MDGARARARPHTAASPACRGDTDRAADADGRASTAAAPGTSRRRASAATALAGSAGLVALALPTPLLLGGLVVGVALVLAGMATCLTT